MSKRRTREQKIRAKPKIEIKAIETDKKQFIIKDLKKTLLITVGFLIILAILKIWLKF